MQHCLLRAYFISSDIISCNLCKYILIYSLPNPNNPNSYQTYMYLHYFSDIVCNYFHCTMAEKSNKEILVYTWKDCGTVKYNDSFKKISDTEVEHLKCQIKKMCGPLTEKHDGVNIKPDTPINVIHSSA